MIDDLSGNMSLLSLCAILRFFDRDQLSSLSPSSGPEVAALLASDQILPSPSMPGTFQLRDKVQATVLAQLRSERPDDEFVLHERAFEYFLERMLHTSTTEQRFHDEERCFYSCPPSFVNCLTCTGKGHAAGPFTNHVGSL